MFKVEFTILGCMKSIHLLVYLSHPVWGIEQMNSSTQLREPEGIDSPLPMMHSGRPDAGSRTEPDTTGGSLAACSGSRA